MIYGTKAHSRFRDTDGHIGDRILNPKTVEMSPYDRITSKYGDEKQAHRLLTAKKLRDSMKFR